MRRHFHPTLSLTILLLLVAACHKHRRIDSGLSMPLRYATNIRCERGDGYSVWTMRNPWDTTAVLHRYILRHKAGTELPLDDAAPTSVIDVPVGKAGVATAVHCGLLDELGVADAIAGVCEKEYIDLPAVARGLADGRIADFGNGMNPNIERIMDVGPDVLLLTPFENSGGYGRVERLGIPIVECAEYMEVSPLARAEWIRFYAELFGVGPAADSIFGDVERRYSSLKHRASAATSRPRLLTEIPYGGQWFVPCGQSTMGMMFDDAGADYVFKDLPGSGSKGLAFETVLDQAHDADLWLVKYNSPQPLTYSQLLADYQPYSRFRAFREQHIYGCDLAHNHFYLQTPFHPERLLRDLIILLHPELMPGLQPVYYSPLAQ